MSDEYRFDYMVEPEATKEAMILAGQKLRIGAGRRFASIAISLVTGLFVTAGGSVLAFALQAALGTEVNTMVVSLAGASAGAALAWNWYNRMIKLMVRGIMDAPFNKGRQRMVLDETGVTLSNPVAEWHTDWSGIHATARGVHGICFFTSGICLTLPLSALEAPDDADALMARIETWRSARPQASQAQA